MSYECINPDFRDWIRLITDSSVEEVTALDFGDSIGYAEIGESRLHWNCCPACRREFPKLPAYSEWAGREYAKSFASELEYCKDHFVAKKQSLLETGGNDAYVRIIADLADAEDNVHQSLRRALMVTQNVFRGEAIEFDTDKQEILSRSREFVSSLNPEVQHFVIASTLCFELLRPMWEKVGLRPRFDPRTHEQILADLHEKIARKKAGEDTGEPPIDVMENLRRAIAESGLEPRVLWEIIESAASAGVSSGVTAVVERLLQGLRGDFDDFADSVKAAQMEGIRLDERSRRKAADYERDIIELIGASLYSELDAATQELLRAAEFLYDLNAPEPSHFDGPAMKLAKAYEHELLLRLAWPVLNSLLRSGVQIYPPPAEKDRRHERMGRNDAKQAKPLVSAGKVQDKNLTVGNIAFCLTYSPDFGGRVRDLGFEPMAISKDAWAVVYPRNDAGHKPFVRRAVADDLRRLILRPDGILSRLHPSATNKSNG